MLSEQCRKVMRPDDSVSSTHPNHLHVMQVGGVSFPANPGSGTTDLMCNSRSSGWCHGTHRRRPKRARKTQRSARPGLRGITVIQKTCNLRLNFCSPLLNLSCGVPQITSQVVLRHHKGPPCLKAGRLLFRTGPPHEVQGRSQTQSTALPSAGRASSSASSRFRSLLRDAQMRPPSCLVTPTMIRRSGDDNTLATGRYPGATRHEHSRHIPRPVSNGISRNQGNPVRISPEAGKTRASRHIRPEGRRASADGDLVSCHGRSSSEQALQA